jgi:hypothetical protein
MRRVRPLLLLLVALAPLLDGCRSARRGSRAELVLVEIENNVPLPTGFTVYAFSDTGARRLIGSLSPGRGATLRLTANDISGRYRFTAVRQLGSAITSPEVALQGGESVVWDLRANTLVRMQ